MALYALPVASAGTRPRAPALTANERKGVAMQTTLNIVFIAFIVIVVGKKLFVWFMEG